MRMFNYYRFDSTDKPKEGTICLFSPVTNLLVDSFQEASRRFLKPYIIPNMSSCEVIRNGKNVCYVRFLKQKLIDMVSPEFLVKRTITKQLLNMLGG